MLTKSGNIICPNCEVKQIQETCTKEDSCQKDSSRANKIGPFIRLRTIVTKKNDTMNDTQENEIDIEGDPREKFFFVESSQRDHLREFLAKNLSSIVGSVEKIVMFE